MTRDLLKDALLTELPHRGLMAAEDGFHSRVNLDKNIGIIFFLLLTKQITRMAAQRLPSNLAT